MKVKKKEYQLLVDLMLLYEDALGDIIYVGSPSTDDDEEIARANEWLAHKRKEIAENALKKGYDLEFGNNTK